METSLGRDRAGLNQEQREMSSGSHNQGEQEQREVEASVEDVEEEPDVQEQVVRVQQPELRRSTRVRKDPSSWVNTSVLQCPSSGASFSSCVLLCSIS
uniref:Uncharacterized protein n=1 Tax=Brassica oleracea TaxID=3712 RepID=A0A3P6EJ52_BRAOL|nr:unnamed protein product [Brassica oleracea]